jgi:hypothetical protein
MLPQKPASPDPTPLDTIAGPRNLDPGQAIMHGDRRATFVRMSYDGAAVIRHWGDSHAVKVSLDTLALPPTKQRRPPTRARSF